MIAFPENLNDFFQLKLCFLLCVPICLDHEDSFHFREIEVGVLIDGNEGLLVHYFQGAGQDAGVHDLTYGPPRILQVFAETLCTMCAGEIRRMLVTQGKHSYRDDYYRSIEAKTASLFAASTEMAGILAGAE